MLSGAGRRSGDGDEVKHDADGSASLSARSEATDTSILALSSGYSALNVVVESTSWCWSEGN